MRIRRIVPTGRIDVRALGRGHRAAAADEHAEERALAAADDAADDRADRGARADARDVLDPSCRRSPAHRRAQPVGDLPMRISSNDSVRLPRRSIFPAATDRAHEPAHDRPGRNRRAASPIFKSSIVVASNRCSTFAVPELSGVCSRTSISVPTGTTHARSRRRAPAAPSRALALRRDPQRLEPSRSAAYSSRVTARLAAHLHAEIRDFVAQIRERLVDVGRERRVGRLEAVGLLRDVGRASSRAAPDPRVVTGAWAAQAAARPAAANDSEHERSIRMATLANIDSQSLRRLIRTRTAVRTC